jgi:pSer/pThr/pTyr-binding forkhead associated (FHA) protein
MTAIIVLVLRILLTVCLYAFLIIALVFLYRELQQSNHLKEDEQIKNIILNLEGEPAKYFAQNEILIGKDPQNDLQLIDKTVSNKQSRIFFSSDQWMIEDSQSENGTYLNDQRILIPTPLKENDLIRFGNTEIRITFPT